jgi:ABC-type multidrug transport system ATPase subunit
VFVSQLLTEVELFCDRVAVMVAGRLKFVGGIMEICKDPHTSEVCTLEAAMRTYYCN